MIQFIIYLYYTDCHTFDRTRKIMTQQFTDDYYEKKLGDGGTGHIMARCNLIHDYLEHRKGKKITKTFTRMVEEITWVIYQAKYGVKQN